VPLLAVVKRILLCHHDVLTFRCRAGLRGTPWGVGAATVVLGPWASMLAVSIALLIQAVFLFGDGGITTLGRELLQHGDRRLAGRALYLPGGGGQNSDHLLAPGHWRRG